MKKLFLITLGALVSLTLQAQQVSRSMLKLRLSDGAPLSVTINGQFIDRNTSILRLDGLEAGQHKVEVYKNRPNKRRPKRIFTGTIRLEPGTVYVGLVDIGSQRLRIKTRPYDPARDGIEASQPAPAASGVTGSATAEGGDGFGAFPSGRDAAPAKPDFAANPVPAGILPATRIATLEKQVMAKTTDGDRLTVLKANLMNAKLSVAQLDGILGWLSFESTRLEFTDWVRSRTADPANLPQLEYRFALDENKEAFRKQLAN